MNQFIQQQTDTICALSTTVGGALAVIRVSGEQAIAIVHHIFKAKNKQSLLEAQPNSLHYGEIVSPQNELIDDVMVSIYHAPKSYTGEHSVEIACHGSRYIIEQTLKLLIDEGCRQAYPGEFTQRAYLNGKMDLSQAEAVADLISSTNSATHKLALSQLKGCVTSELTQLRNQLLQITSLIELELDFSDQDVTFANRQELLSLANEIQQKIQSLVQSFEAGKAIKQGIPVAIVGKTNVGKSTLLNALLKEEKAIVSDIHGTTRDVIEDTTTIHGITFRFIDTAGIRKTNDTIENLGIERTYQKINEATIVLWLVDNNPTPKEYQEINDNARGKKIIIIQNKIDREQVDKMPEIDIQISAKYNINISLLEELIFKAANLPAINENNVIVTNARHYAALSQALGSINRVIDGLHNEISGDLLSEDLRICLDQLSEITGGQITSTEVLHNIFKHFCIGK